MNFYRTAVIQLTEKFSCQVLEGPAPSEPLMGGAVRDKGFAVDAGGLQGI